MLQVKNISYAYQKEKVLENISFSVNKGACLAIAGESGSGKSTLLKLLYGTYDLHQGEIYWNDDLILGPKFNLITGPDYMKYVAQEFDLMLYTSVETNIGEFLSNLDLKKKQQRIDELVSVVELEEVAKTHVRYLSGGQKQRVALARALAKEPEVLLLDEPFSHIDNLKKQSLRRSLFGYLREKQITCLVATHDKDDIISFANQMLFLHKGESLAFGMPNQLYEHPKNKLIASFFDEYSEFKLSDLTNEQKFGTLIVYPHQLKIIPQSELKAEVLKSYFRGDHYLIECLFKDQPIFLKHTNMIESNTVISFEIDRNKMKNIGL